MKISTKSRYALRIMIYLADHYRFGYISVKDISEEENLSPKYVEHIMSKLLKAGLITALRGARGGYRLAASPSKYSVDNIIKVMENYTSFTPCTNINSDGCPKSKECVAADIWQLLQATVEELFCNITLLDILHMQQNKINAPSLYLTYLNHKKET